MFDKPICQKIENLNACDYVVYERFMEELNLIFQAAITSDDLPWGKSIELLRQYRMFKCYYHVTEHVGCSLPGRKYYQPTIEYLDLAVSVHKSHPHSLYIPPTCRENLYFHSQRKALRIPKSQLKATKSYSSTVRVSRTYQKRPESTRSSSRSYRK